VSDQPAPRSGDQDRPVDSARGTEEQPARGTEPPVPGSGDGGIARERRPHPLTPLIRGWIVLLAILLGIGREFIPNGTDQRGLRDVPVLFIIGGIVVVVLISAAGAFLTWWFTRYVIDETELRIETGMATKRSRRIGFNRIQSVDLVQPLAARLFSLAELRIEAGSGEGVRIRYLPRKEAARLRDYLLARAHGHDAADPSARSTASALSDHSADDRVIVTINPAQLIGGLLLSGDFLIMALVPVGVLVAGVFFDFWLYTLPALLPYAFGLVGMVSRRVVNQFNYSLADTGHGLRITRGLTNLTSQSLPIDRIQGIRIRQPLLWRRLDWHRVDVDVLGYGSADEGANRSDANSMLLPVATRAQLEAALAGCLPGIDTDAVPLTPVPRRARWLRWWDFWSIGYGVDDRIAVNTEGWLTRRKEIVPHGKTQSARLSQGPLQRRLGLASVHIDTTKGPVDWDVPHLDAESARDFVLDQMVRAHRARGSLTGGDGARRLDRTTQEVRDGVVEPDLRQDRQ